MLPGLSDNELGRPVLLVTMPEEITAEENERRFRESLCLINNVTHEQLVKLMGEEFLEEYRRQFP